MNGSNKSLTERDKRVSDCIDENSIRSQIENRHSKETLKISPRG